MGDEERIDQPREVTPETTEPTEPIMSFTDLRAAHYRMKEARAAAEGRQLHWWDY